MKMRRISLSSSDLASFTNDILKEAESASGTWSLATYTHLKEMINIFRESDVDFLLESVIEKLANEETQPATRYKLAQLCSIFHSMQIPIVENYYRKAQEKIEKVILIFGGDGDTTKVPPLVTASNKLLRSIYEDPAKRRFSVQPTTTNLVGADRRTSNQTSKTPEPSNYK